MARKLKGNGDQMCLTAVVDGDLIVTGYEEGLVKLWDLRCENDSPVLSGCCGQKTDTSNEPKDDISSISFTNKQNHDIYISAGKCIYHVDTRNAKEVSWEKPLFELNEDDINQIAISETDEMLAAADDNNVITVIDLENSRLLTKLKKHKNVVYTVQFRRGKPRELISGGYDCSLIHWDVLKSRVMGAFNLSDLTDPNWELPKSFNPSYVLACEFGSLNCLDSRTSNIKSNIVMAGTENGNLHCFHCEKNLLHYRTFRAHDLGVTQVHFVKGILQGDTVKNNVVYSGGNDGKIKLWDVHKLFTELPMEQEPEALHVIDHGSKINCLCSIGSKCIAVCDTGCDVTLLPLEI